MHSLVVFIVHMSEACLLVSDVEAGLRSRRRSRLRRFLPLCLVEISSVLPRREAAKRWHFCCRCLDTSLINRRWRKTMGPLVRHSLWNLPVDTMYPPLLSVQFCVAKICHCSVFFLSYICPASNGKQTKCRLRAVLMRSGMACILWQSSGSSVWFN